MKLVKKTIGNSYMEYLVEYSDGKREYLSEKEYLEKLKEVDGKESKSSGR